MSPTFSDLAPTLLAVVSLSLLMVFVMVQWSRALLNRPDPSADPEPGMSPGARWGMTYFLAWAVLIAAFLYFLPQVGRTDLLSNLLLMLLAAAGWVAFNLLLVAFARAIQQANQRDAMTAGRRKRTEEEDHAAWSAIPAERQAPAAGLRERLRNALRTARNVVLALLVIAIGEALPPLQWLHAWVTAHAHALFWIFGPIGSAGYVVFMGCAIHLALYGGRPGAQGEDSASFAEVKAAWRARAWKANTRWRRLFLMMFGAAFMATGIIGSIFVIAPAGIKFLLGIAYLYAAVRTAAGFVKTRSDSQP